MAYINFPATYRNSHHIGPYIFIFKSEITKHSAINDMENKDIPKNRFPILNNIAIKGTYTDKTLGQKGLLHNYVVLYSFMKWLHQ